MDVDSNPYVVDGADSAVVLSITQLLLAVAVGFIVLVCSAMTMAAFLFGVLVAVQGTSMPTPIEARLLWDGPLRHWMQAGLVVDLVVAVSLSLYATLRILRKQRLLMEAAVRRRELIRQVDELQMLQTRNRPE